MPMGGAPELETLEILRTVLDNLPTGIYLVDRERRIRYWNRGAEEISGYHRHDVIGRRSRENILRGCDDVGCALCGAACPLSVVILDGKASESPVFVHHKEGQRVPVQLRVLPIRDAHGSIVCAAVSFEETRETAELHFRPSSLAAHGCLDVITGTPNHAFMQSHLRENLAFFNEYHLPFGILSIQVEKLAELQATHGRESVEVMLHVVAQTMKHAVRPDGVLGRWNENQFLAIVTNCNAAQLETLGQSLTKMAGSSGIQWWDDLLSVKVSVGHSMVQPGDSLESLLARAQGSLEAQVPRGAAAVAAGTNQPSPKL